MMKKQPNGMILLLIRGFSDERLNLLSSRYPDFHYLKTDIQKLQIMYLHAIHFKEFKNLIDNEFSVSMKLRTYKIINEFGDIYNYVTSWVYNNQECVDIKNYSWECVKSRGQPPPSGEGKGLSDQRKAIISDISADWHKNHQTYATGAESYKNHLITEARKI